MEFKREDVTRGFMIKEIVKQRIHFEIFDVYKEIAISALKNYRAVYGTELMEFVNKLPGIANKFDLDARKEMFVSDKEADEIADELDSLATAIISELDSIKSRSTEDTSWVDGAVDSVKKLGPIVYFFETAPLY